MSLRPVVAALLVLAGMSARSIAQTTPAQPDRAQVLTAARDVMSRARYCTLVTVAADGQPQARIVDPSDPDPDLTIWLGTNAATRKVGQLRANSKVTLSYFDKDTLSYVTLLGSGVLVSEVSEKQKHWQAKWAPFYPNGAAGADFILIRFKAEHLEIVSAAHKLVNDLLTWRPVTLDLKEGGGRD